MCAFDCHFPVLFYIYFTNIFAHYMFVSMYASFFISFTFSYNLFVDFSSIIHIYVLILFSLSRALLYLFHTYMCSLHVCEHVCFIFHFFHFFLLFRRGFFIYYTHIFAHFMLFLSLILISEPTILKPFSYAVFCLNKTIHTNSTHSV